MFLFVILSADIPADTKPNKLPKNINKYSFARTNYHSWIGTWIDRVIFQLRDYLYLARRFVSSFILNVNHSDFIVTKTYRRIIEKKFAMHLTGWPCTWRNYPHVAISARWRHRWCGKSGLSFSFSFEVLIDDCASLTVPTSITLLARSKPAVSYRILAFAAIVPRSCEVWLTSSSPLRLFIHPRRPATMFRSSLTFIFRYARHADNLLCMKCTTYVIWMKRTILPFSRQIGASADWPLIWPICRLEKLVFRPSVFFRESRASSTLPAIKR